MNCDCIARIEKKFIDEIKWTEKKILTAELQSLYKIDPEFKRLTSSHVSVTLEGRKNKVDIDLSHTYCPFCGKKIESEEGNKMTTLANG